jgi:simple sugar transport system ATP-binding protein
MPQPSAQSTSPLLRLSRATKHFGGVLALDAVDWEVMAGEVHCLVGENGSGKSTMIKLVAGVHDPDPGTEIEVDGTVHASITPHLAKALGIHVIYQDLSLFPNLSVAENIAIDQVLGGSLRLVRRRSMREIAARALARLGFKLALDKPVASFSIAERQVIAICRGLAAEARLLIMDEPTASLTRAEVKRLLGIVAKLKGQGIAIVFVSHRLEEVVEIAERVTVLRDGRKVGIYPPSEIDSKRLAELMTGLSVEHKVVARDVTKSAPLLEVADLARTGEFADVGFTLHRGEVLGLTGLLGAGRTELALSLFGMAPPDSGKIRIEGNDVVMRSNRDAIRAGIAYLSEDRLNLGLNMRQSVKDNLVLAVLGRLANRIGWIKPGRRRAAAENWVSRLKIRTASVEASVQQLSGGNQQRVSLAKWLATDPRILILDSPTVGVDVGNKQGIYEMIRELAGHGIGILLISDEIPEVYYTCDRVLHMRAGRVVGVHVPGEISEHELEEHVYA